MSKLQLIREIEVKSFNQVYLENTTETVEVSGHVLPRKDLVETVMVQYGMDLLAHLGSPKWIIRGYESAKGFEIRLSSSDPGPALRLCRMIHEHPESYLGNEQMLDPYEIYVFGPDHKYGAPLFRVAESGMDALAEAFRAVVGDLAHS